MVERLTIVGMQANNADEPDKTRRERRGTRWLFVKGRLAPGASAEEAQAQVSTVFARLEQEYPNTNEDMKAAVLGRSSVRFHPMVDNILATAGAVLLAAVGMILMIACANVANMLLARAANRSREIAVRLSVGASRGRLVRQLMTESLMLATLGGVMSVALAYWAARVLSVAKPPLPIPIEFAYELDTSVMAFAFFVSLATAVLFGLVPAFRASRPNLVPALKGEGIGIDDPTKRRFTLSNALVVGQLAVSLVLLVAGALLTRGFIEAQRTDVGFDASRVATLGFNLQMNNYSLEKAQALQRQLLESLPALPGVQYVTLASRMPLAPNIHMEGIFVPEIHQTEDDIVPLDVVYVGEDYFRVTGIPIVQGRAFAEQDREGAPRVLIVNETMAARYWPGRSAVRAHLHWRP